MQEAQDRIKELLKPRYKMIADYPDTIEVVGMICEAISGKQKEYYDKYPHLFKKLEWWEERKVEDFPNYVKVVFNLKDNAEEHIYFYKIFQWDLDNSRGFVNAEFSSVVGLYDGITFPATEQDYNDFINQNK